MTNSRTFALLPVTIMAKVHDDQPMVLHEQLATGTTAAGDEFTINRSMPGGTLFIKLKGKCYEVGVRDIMDGLLDGIKKKEDPRGERESDLHPEVKS